MNRTLLRIRCWAAGRRRAGRGRRRRRGPAVYRCPRPPVLYTDAITRRGKRANGLQARSKAAVTVVAGTPPRDGRRRAGAASAPRARRAGCRASTPATQRARDSDARAHPRSRTATRGRSALAELRKEYNNGEPEKQGNERNYQKYLDRVAELKAGIARNEADIAGIRSASSAKLPRSDG